MTKKAKPLYRKKGLRSVTTRDYIDPMKAKSSSLQAGTEEEPSSAVLQEIASVPGVGATISVRAAKAHLSALLDQVASGREVVITSDGVPKARLVPMAQRPRKVFTGTREHLKVMPPWRGGSTADEIIREDRDARG
jgi:prevent-host-death family protein